MAILTKEALEPNRLGYYVDWNVLSRGQQYYQENRVRITNFDGESATCQVHGHTGNYTVIVTAEANQRVGLSCNCPQGTKVRFCKHMIAAMLTVRDYIKKEVENRWQYRLGLALGSVPKRAAARAPRAKYVALLGLNREKIANGGYEFRMATYKVNLQEWPGADDLTSLPELEARNQFLDEHRNWTLSTEYSSQKLDPRSVLNLSPEGVELYNLILRNNSSYYYYGITDFGLFLPLLAKLDIPVFLTTSRNTFKERLQLFTSPVTMEAALVQDGTDYALQAGLRMNGQVFSTVKKSLLIVCQEPAWALAGKYLIPVENPEALNLLRFLPLTIPQKDVPEFREKYLHQMVERIPVQGDVLSWQDVAANPIPRLYLNDESGSLRATLTFGYGDYELDANPRADPIGLIDIPDSWGMVRIHRQSDAEQHYYGLLADSRYRLKRAARELGPAVFELRARTHPFDFLMYAIPLLTQAGFEIYGDEKLKSGKINRSVPTISLNITSGLDWFDLDVQVKFGQEQVSLQEVRRAMRKGEHYIKLADGSIGQIPELWLERYKRLFDLAEETESGLRLRDFHLPLVDKLLEDAGETQTPAEFIQRRERLRNFEQIQPQSVPQGFIGELRPYQKAGLDWLYFLRQYGFGGCLADDMGLGKTVQVLAFLQSLRENNPAPQSASLLVVPKSLLTNWQRESSRFTPGLRFLEYMGNARQKDTASFNDYDIVLTTYGTMLRDIELLRSYRFHYAILDESQSIKNPLAQSAKAARLLQAEHRLVMTGTPVENNTFELWSQFAFLNPGLLGSMDYFKREFATPIESRASQETADLLRRLVFPFILRRTKEQVAPELPPRTERIIYTDLEPAQRKLYTHTRDRYRAELLGLIESEGMNDARMKILEGLLRLRQICIHPLLVEPTYRGESAKFEMLFETLETLHAEGHKALIFSQFVETLKLIQVEMHARKLRYTYLDGKTQDRQGQVDLFQNDASIPFFLISLKAGGVGLNLTAADYVIHLDPWWNPAVEMQAADRTHRIGQEKPVFIYKFIARDTVEEKILQLQDRKRELVQQLISAEGSFFKSITPEDVKVLFS
ncbi:MAG TPA: DEAD/DEAH box helicase [Anaerolineales bacterium]|nr:DEAD/DEAH box helicase [Anaerolineales bacterium]